MGVMLRKSKANKLQMRREPSANKKGNPFNFETSVPWGSKDILGSLGLVARLQMCSTGSKNLSTPSLSRAPLVSHGAGSELACEEVLRRCNLREHRDDRTQERYYLLLSSVRCHRGGPWSSIKMSTR